MADSTDVRDLIKGLASNPQLLAQLNSAGTLDERRALLTGAGLPILSYEDLREGIKAMLSPPAAGGANPSATAQTGTTTGDEADMDAVSAVTAAACAETCTGCTVGCGSFA